MREAGYVTAQIFNKEQLKLLNETIQKNLVKGTDNPNRKAIKTSQVKFVRLLSIQKLILPLMDFITTTNAHHYGFDLFQSAPSKILNFNTIILFFFISFTNSN